MFDYLLSILAPHDCLACGTEGALLCRDCALSLAGATERCYRCHRFMPDAVTCPACRKLTRLRSVRAAHLYRGAAKDLVWKLKLAGARAGARQMAAQMLSCLPAADDTVIVPVPTATTRIRRRGYDQATLLARELARQSKGCYIACLARTSQLQQHGSRREQRLTQLMTAFRLINSRPVRGRHVVLVDDVVTTGATLEAAAAILKAAGAARIDAVVFAQA